MKVRLAAIACASVGGALLGPPALAVPLTQTPGRALPSLSDTAEPGSSYTDLYGLPTFGAGADTGTVSGEDGRGSLMTGPGGVGDGLSGFSGPVPDPRRDDADANGSMGSFFDLAPGGEF
ncbi:hypothetical protein [Roseisalinus antarcticus]|uniref:Uncharacterized protein n=1 Tax=Roseisalinus antarcticus TaxID=254357 RepID=A0A1Y5TNN8_9RHOB|nr:hypothetical protein [Roseisalinus antarcticus]SLN64658.1 hypothetical protein ROA7023_03036 [Roseisalinus antarcticus]